MAVVIDLDAPGAGPGGGPEVVDLDDGDGDGGRAGAARPAPPQGPGPAGPSDRGAGTGAVTIDLAELPDSPASSAPPPGSSGRPGRRGAGGAGDSDFAVLSPGEVKSTCAQCGAEAKRLKGLGLQGCAHWLCRKCVNALRPRVREACAEPDGVAGACRALACPVTGCGSLLSFADCKRVLGPHGLQKWLQGVRDRVAGSFQARTSCPVCPGVDLTLARANGTLTTAEMRLLLRCRNRSAKGTAQALAARLAELLGGRPPSACCQQCGLLVCSACGGGAEAKDEAPHSCPSPQLALAKAIFDAFGGEEEEAVAKEKGKEAAPTQQRSAFDPLRAAFAFALGAGSGAGGGVGYGGASGRMGGAGDKKKLRDGQKRAMKEQGARDRKLEADFLRVEAEISKCGGCASAVAAACFFGSRLPQVLFGILQNDSVQDIAERKALYEATFKLCLAMVTHDDWMALLHHREEDAKGKDATEASPLLDSFKNLDQQAQTLKKRGRNVSGIADDPALVSTALRICSVAEQVAQAQKRYKRTVQRRNQGNRRAAAEGGRLEIQPIKEEYVKSLQDLRFREVRNLPANKSTFCFSAAAKKAGKNTRGANVKVRARRLVKEIAAMRTSLPLSWNSSVFVVCDEDRIDCFKAMVVPGDDTPYAHAPFLFDIFCDEQYPNKPPQVKLLTTGGGTVRFNPNLYANGKVCLSLLGTWSGPGWDPKESMILQIILSIQSMILGVADPVSTCARAPARGGWRLTRATIISTTMSPGTSKAGAASTTGWRRTSTTRASGTTRSATPSCRP